jgi:hypothetical protein
MAITRDGANRVQPFRVAALLLSASVLGCQGSVPTQNIESENKIEFAQASVHKAIDPKIERQFRPLALSTTRKTVPVSAKSRRQSIAGMLTEEPFLPGDRLAYDIYYLGVRAGTVEFSVLPFQEVQGRKAYHLRSAIESSRVLKWVYRITTTSETVMDFEDLFSHRFEVSFEDRRQTKHYVEIHDQKRHRSHLWAKRISRELGDQEKNETVQIKPNVQDGLSGIAYAAFLPLAPRQKYSYAAITEGKPWTAHIHVADLEPYKHPEMGLIQALRIEPKRVWDRPDDAPPHASQLDFVAWVLPKTRRLAAVELRTKFGLIKVMLKSFKRSGSEVDLTTLN